MRIKKTIVILIVFQAISGTYFEITNFYYPFWIQNLRFPDLFDFSQFLLRLFGLFSYVLTFIGVYKLIILKKIDIINTFKFPIYFFTIANIFWFITTLFSTEYSFFILPEGTPWYSYIFKSIGIVLLILIIINYFGSKNVTNPNTPKIEVKKHARLFNYILDLIIILSFGFKNIRFLFDGFVFEDIDFLQSNPNWFFLIHIFFYYFVMEFLFLQTIGKLHNNAMVEYTDTKFKSVLIRTFCRFIPFEAFSFFGKNGWHDSISKTQVTIAMQTTSLSDNR